MAEEIIDLRDRIEKMRIQIENEATEQISVDAPLEVHQKTCEKCQYKCRKALAQSFGSPTTHTEPK